jgi:putative lipoic acid-binding regulatory protein
MKKTKPEALLDFPCRFQFKAIGVADDSFKAEIVAVVESFVVVSEDCITCRPSENGGYQAVSVSVRLENYQQLTGIYAAMRKVSGLKLLL